MWLEDNIGSFSPLQADAKSDENDKIRFA